MKGKKREDIDVSTLPEVACLAFSLNYLTKEANAKRTKEAILKTKRTDFSFLTREELKTFAKEKGLFIPADDKKKDKAAEDLPREATPAVLAEAFSAWLDQQILTKRLEKKEINDALAAGKPLPTKKKDDKKKDHKKKGHEEEIEEVEEIYTKNYDHAFLVENYPEGKEEMVALGKVKGGVSRINDR